MRRRDLAAAALVAAASGAPTPAAAQAAVAPASRNACLDALPASALQPVPVFLSPNLTGASKPHVELHGWVDGFAQSVAQTVRAFLGAAGAALPAAEPGVTWRSLESDLRVVARRDGSITWHVVPDSVPDEERLDDAGALLVGRAIDTLRARGERLVFPEDFALDSIEWLLQIKPSFRNADGTVTKQKMRAGFPIFSVLMPLHRGPRADRLHVQYPEIMRRQGFMGQIVMLFTIDTTGRVVRSSIRDQRPAEYSALGATAQTAYERFVRSVGDELARAIYEPARIGGCLVTAHVRQQFTFTLDEGRRGADPGERRR